MLGILLVLLAISSIGAAGYQGGKAECMAPEKNPQQQRNTSMVIAAVALMLAMCAVFMLQTGWNPFASMMSGNNGTMSYV
jgi:uncharacterized membrane protein YidH (DUF202 family)